MFCGEIPFTTQHTLFYGTYGDSGGRDIGWVVIGMVVMVMFWWCWWLMIAVVIVAVVNKSIIII